MLRELSRRAGMMVILENKLKHWYACTRHFLQPSSVVLINPVYRATCDRKHGVRPPYHTGTIGS